MVSRLTRIINEHRYIWRLKQCPRCHGDLYKEYEGDWACFQCGNRIHKGTFRKQLY